MPEAVVKSENNIVELELDVAYEEADQLKDREVYENRSTKIIRGIHPEYGPIAIIIPALGDVMMMPLSGGNWSNPAPSFAPPLKPVMLTGVLADTATLELAA